MRKAHFCLEEEESPREVVPAPSDDNVDEIGARCMVMLLLDWLKRSKGLWIESGMGSSEEREEEEEFERQEKLRSFLVGLRMEVSVR